MPLTSPSTVSAITINQPHLSLKADSDLSASLPSPSQQLFHPNSFTPATQTSPSFPPKLHPFPPSCNTQLTSPYDSSAPSGAADWCGLGCGREMGTGRLQLSAASSDSKWSLVTARWRSGGSRAMPPLLIIRPSAQWRRLLPDAASDSASARVLRPWFEHSGLWRPAGVWRISCTAASPFCRADNILRRGGP